MNQLNEAEFAVEEARRRLQNAETDFARVEGLVQQGAIPKVELQPVQLALDLARQQVIKAETALQLLRDGISKRTGRQFNIITATAAGTLLDVPMKTGANIVPSNSLNEGTTIASIANLGNMIFIGKAIEGVVGKIKVGQQALLSLGAHPDDTLTSVIYFISPKGKDNNGNIEFEVKSRIAQHSGVVVRAGYSANARVVINRKAGCMALPESAIAYKGDSTFAEILVDSTRQTFRRVSVQTGISDGVQTEIRSSHPPGTRFRKVLE
jgi:HlyD family secretion protein